MNAEAAAFQRIRQRWFPDWLNSITTLALTALLAYLAWRFGRWAIADAVWRPDSAACRAVAETGACWGVITEKFRLILLGRYPFDQQWRPLLATLLLLGLMLISAQRRYWRPALLVAWALVLIAFIGLMRGGAFGLPVVETARWGGLPLTLLLSVVGIAGAFPLALLLALGRYGARQSGSTNASRLLGLQWLCTAYIELIRGVPLISVLFMASFLFPLLMPSGVSIDVLLRVLIGIVLFSAAYLAEVVRGGLQAVPIAQREAAASLGMSYWQTQCYIVLPQALRIVVPAIVNTFIGVFKDTSLVTIVSLYELTGSLQLALGDAEWRMFFLEGYLFIAAIYFGFCLAMSRYSRWLERRLATPQ